MKFKFTLVFSFIIITLILLPNSSSNTIFSAACDPIGTNINATGLITARTGEGFGTSSGKCVMSDDAVLKTANIPTYADLKSKYYDQSKAEKSKIDRDGTQSDLSSITADTVYYVTGSFTLSGNPPASANKTYVVFIYGDLTISSDYTYADSDAQHGTVFVVQGNVNILSNVIRIDAVIISEGIISTAGRTCTGEVPASSLTINGSLISLNQDQKQPTDPPPIRFCRTLAEAGNDTAPAEIIKHEVKYLVILRDILSDTVQKWTEVLN